MMTTHPRAQRTDTLLRRGIGVILMLLVIQYVSGMALNLYITLPPDVGRDRAVTEVPDL